MACHGVLALAQSASKSLGEGGTIPGQSSRYSFLRDNYDDPDDPRSHRGHKGKTVRSLKEVTGGVPGLSGLSRLEQLVVICLCQVTCFGILFCRQSTARHRIKEPVNSENKIDMHVTYAIHLAQNTQISHVGTQYTSIRHCTYCTCNLL